MITSIPKRQYSIMPYIPNKRPMPKPPQNNVMVISKTLKAVNDIMDWTVLFIALLLVMVWKGTPFRSYLSLLSIIYSSYSRNAASISPSNR